jgi:hypothetical protein
VNIRILEPEESGATGATASGSRVVRIFGNNAQNVASARAEVEYVEEVPGTAWNMGMWHGDFSTFSPWFFGGKMGETWETQRFVIKWR